MKSNDLTILLTTIKYAIDYPNEMDQKSNMWLCIETYYIEKSYGAKDLSKDIDKLREFVANGYDLFNRDFLGLGVEDSISAAACPLQTQLDGVLNRI